VTITAVSFVPCAPLLVPDVAGGSASLDDDIRDACLTVTRSLHDAEEIVVVAPTDAPGQWDSEASWDFRGFGVSRDGRAGPVLPWQLGIGAWFLDGSGWTGARRYLGVTQSDGYLDLPQRRVGLLAVGDGSACRTEKAPGHLDERAAGFDELVATMLRTGDVDGLGRLDGELATQLMCSGFAVWRAVRAALDEARPSGAELLVDDARYGVGYFVAAWTFG
jgi:hypothetical protein